jgi:hypothetical protein
MKYLVNISKVSDIDQTSSETIGKMRLCSITCVSPGEVQHEYVYPCQWSILLLHR